MISERGAIRAEPAIGYRPSFGDRPSGVAIGRFEASLEAPGSRGDNFPLKFPRELPKKDTRVRDMSADHSRSLGRLLERWRPYDSRRLTHRELRVEGAAAATFAVVALAMALLLPHSRPFDPLLAWR